MFPTDIQFNLTKAGKDFRRHPIPKFCENVSINTEEAFTGS
jgi:hypothetical protein